MYENVCNWVSCISLSTIILVIVVLILASPKTTLKIIGFFLRHTFIRLRIFGDENIPYSGPVLLVSNHISLIDLLLIQSLCRRKVRFMIRAEIIDFVPTRFIFWYLGVERVPNPLHPKAFKNFFETIRHHLRNGEVCCMFPEGAISGNGNLMRFRSQIQPLLPADVETVVLPVRIGMIHGRLFSWANNKLLFNWPKSLPVDFSITIGDPVTPDITAFELRQKISELGAAAERRPQPGELPLHTSFLMRTKHHFFQQSFCDASTEKWINNFNMLVRSLILSWKIRELDKGGDSGYAGVLMPNSTTAAALMLGVLFADRTPAVINFSAGEQVALESARRAGVKTIFTSRQFIAKLKWEPTEDMIFLEDVAPQIGTKQKLKAVLMTLLLPRRTLIRNVAPFSCYNMHRQAVLLFSSGSTGKPKAVMLTHRNINCDIWSFVRMIALDSTCEDRIVGNLPLFHAYGFTVLFAFPAQHGTPVVYNLNPLSGDEVVKAIERFKLTILTATPTFLQRYLHKATKEQLESLRLVVTGAEKLRPELADAYFKLTGKNVVEGYGCTELSPIVTVNFNNSIFDMGTRSAHPGSIGCPLPGIHVRVVDPETGVELGPGKPGRMQVKAGTVMKGYLNDPEQTARVLQNGYYDTGDIARLDEDGFIYITGRASRFSKIGGEMVPHEGIEDAIAKFRKSEVREVAVTGKSDSRKGERLVVFYTPEDLNPAEVIEFMRNEKLPNIWLPKADDFVHVAELPILGSGKLNLRKLKEMAENL